MSKAIVNEVLERLFRRESGRMVATLARVFGPGRLDLAESVVQDALLKAMQVWPFEGIPANPAGWLVSVARNRALDHLRRETLHNGKEVELGKYFDGTAPENPLGGALKLDAALRDDQLRLLFICCHPSLSRDMQSALALKTLFGFGVHEIAAAFLTKEATVAQRLVRAKEKIKDEALPYELPNKDALPARLPAVLEVLYLLFSEGYNTHGGDKLVREDICAEALRVTALLADHEALHEPEVDALLALMCFHASRLDARTDADGDILLLEDQDRGLWDQALIARGAHFLGRAAAGDRLTSYHLEAGIAACHALAPSSEATDWRAIVSYYDDLLALAPSPVVALNRAVALAFADGPEKGLHVLLPLKKEKALADYYLLAGVEAELRRKLGQEAEARECYRQALATTVSAPERRFLEKRLAQLMAR